LPWAETVPHNECVNGRNGDEDVATPFRAGGQFHDSRIEVVLGSVAPPGLVSVWRADPQLTLWAIVCRCSAAGATAQRDAPTQEPALENEWRGW